MVVWFGVVVCCGGVKLTKRRLVKSDSFIFLSIPTLIHLFILTPINPSTHILFYPNIHPSIYPIHLLDQRKFLDEGVCLDPVNKVGLFVVEW